MIYVETARLRLRDWQDSDLEPFRRLNADEEVMAYFPKTLSAEETAAFLRAIQAEFDACGYGLYAAETKENDAFIGFIGFHRATFEADFTPCVEIGWRLARSAWGKGYATEGAEACLTYGWGELGFADVYSFTAEANAPSKNVMRKIGMRFVKHFNHPKIGTESPLSKHVLYHARQNDENDRR
ncbi:GNAT family N-acetyltransferase [Paenibacillus glycinis]|uniref:GNAT family N-acetyltransferase n=1 Tax=Paenibacillus glycinis TaxID=2697035 RepID=A0ABW9XQR1_9BACL|nr:GNAT family N-acetyltransferase [Paenibacillus glycinis]NBD24702.1 GNAT family N-acetyltransferase [Paenibacillus glycinis]